MRQCKLNESTKEELPGIGPWWFRDTGFRVPIELEPTLKK